MIEQIKNKLPLGTKKAIKRNVERIKKPFRDKVFCISMQRTGTTSVGDFLADHGYNVARWGDSHYYNWPYQIFKGDYEAVFSSNSFKAYNAFEDGPWFSCDIYRVLFHRFPGSRFILLSRNSDEWFGSMVRHSKGKILGNTYRHCKIYQRLGEYYDKLDNDPSFKPTENEIDNLMSLEAKKEHYIRMYEEYNRDVKEFFKRYDSKRLFTGKLEDEDKWQKIGGFLNIRVNKNYKVHSNKS